MLESFDAPIAPKSAVWIDAHSYPLPNGEPSTVDDLLAPIIPHIGEWGLMDEVLQAQENLDASMHELYDHPAGPVEVYIGTPYGDWEINDTPTPAEEESRYHYSPEVPVEMRFVGQEAAIESSVTEEEPVQVQPIIEIEHLVTARSVGLSARVYKLLERGRKFLHR